MARTGYNCGKHTEDDRFGKKLKLGLDLGSKLLGLLWLPVRRIVSCVTQSSWCDDGLHCEAAAGDAQNFVSCEGGQLDFWRIGHRQNLIDASFLVFSTFPQPDLLGRFFLVKMPSCSSSSWALVAGIVYLLFASLLAVTLARFGLFNCISSFHQVYRITFQLRIRHWVQHVHVEGELGKISQRGGGGDALVHCCSVFLWYLGAKYSWAIY